MNPPEQENLPAEQNQSPAVQPTEIITPAPGQQQLFGVDIHQGPLPRASEFQAYESVLPGSADRILKMAEREQKANIHLSWGGLVFAVYINVGG